MTTLVRLKPKRIEIPGKQLEYVGPYGLVSVKQMPLITNAHAPTSRREPALARAFHVRMESALPLPFRCRSYCHGRWMADPTPNPKTCQACGAEFTDKRPTRPQRFCSRPCARTSAHQANRDKPKVPWQERFWSFVPTRDTSECWEWSGKRNDQSYGVLTTQGRQVISAHRASYTIHNGAIPDGLCVLHRCDNPPCVNPTHLFLGTRADNNADKVAKGRQVTLEGEQSARTRYSDETVREIRRRHSDGERPAAIALALGVSRSNVAHIVKGRTRRAA